MTYGTLKMSCNSLISKGLIATKLSNPHGSVIGFTLLTLCFIKEKFSACGMSRIVV